MYRWHVYEDWTIEDVPRCFYVGKGDNNRINKKYRNRYHVNIVNTYGIDRRIVLSTNDEIVAFNLERQLIIKRQTHPKATDYNGIGCNRTMGGQGNSGRIVTDETRKKISENKKGKTPNKIWSQAERDALSTRMSILHKGKHLSKKHIEILRERMANNEIKQEMINKVTLAINHKYENDNEFYERVVNSRARGEAAGNSLLTTHDVKQIRIDWELIDKTTKGNRWSGASPSRLFCQKMAKQFGVTSQAIYSIVTNKTWRHI